MWEKWAENGPGQGQIQTRTEASVQAWAGELSAAQGIRQGQRGVNSQRRQVGAGVLRWWGGQRGQPGGKETPLLPLPGSPLLIAWASAQTSFP